MSEIQSFITDAAQSGRAVDYQDHLAAVNRLARERDEARGWADRLASVLDCYAPNCAELSDYEDYSKAVGIDKKE